MKTINEIKAEQRSKFDTLIKECKMFFAFSNEQFATNKTPLQEGDKYVSIGAGGYMPKSQVQNYLDGSKAIDKWYKSAIKAIKGARRANIVHELNNHEAFYTGDIEDTYLALGKGYTRKEIYKVYREELAKQTA